MRLEMRNTSRPIEVLNNWRINNALELDAPYQRGVVWGIKRQRNLIQSIILGVPIPAIVLNDRARAAEHVPADALDSDDIFKMAVIDGKQRITTVLKFMDGQLDVPIVWYKSDIDYSSMPRKRMVTWNQLTTRQRMHFKHHPLACCEGAVRACDEKLIFDLINFGGLQQGEVDDDL